jgi:oxygen-independent coproporphyrinogen-3 oxidase
MRKTKGISFAVYRSKFGEDLESVYKQQIVRFEKEGLIKSTEQGIQFTLRGIDLSNYVLSEFV